MTNLFDIPGRGVGLSNLFERLFLWCQINLTLQFDTPKKGEIGLSNLFERA